MVPRGVALTTGARARWQPPPPSSSESRPRRDLGSRACCCVSVLSTRSHAAGRLRCGLMSEVATPVALGVTPQRSRCAGRAGRVTRSRTRTGRGARGRRPRRAGGRLVGDTRVRVERRGFHRGTPLGPLEPGAVGPGRGARRPLTGSWCSIRRGPRDAGLAGAYAVPLRRAWHEAHAVVGVSTM
jgi:hypothetical protein